MHFSSITVKNYRCLHDAATTLTNFTTIIGENNAGKSSLLQAISLFIRGTKLTYLDFYNKDEDIVLDVVITNVKDQDLDTIAEQHRERIIPLLQNGTMRLVRRYKPDGSSSLRCFRPIPLQPRYRSDVYNGELKGKTGTVLRDYLTQTYPEHIERFTSNTQASAKQVIEEIAGELPPEQLIEEETELPTGIDNSIKNLLPEPIYIPAVKDLSDEVKTKETTSFGRLLSVLFNVIGTQLTETEETFATLNRKLNRVRNDDGSWEDQRLDEVRAIENTIAGYVRENFPNISLEIQVPPPEIKTILSSAKVVVDDGVPGLIDSKGDGLKRSVTFSILRAYITLSTKPEWQKPGGKEGRITDRYLFLFEEPELYLHPKAQMILYEALCKISQNHQVIISTHSPLFLSPHTSGTFIKINKIFPSNGEPPFSKLIPVDLNDLDYRDLYQMLCFENNSAAFFGESVVLIEGDSDEICYCHIAKTLNPEWDFTKHRVSMVRVGGKGNIKRYREFFSRFAIHAYIITDLDILVRDFDKLGLPQEINEQRNSLLALVDEIIKKEGIGEEGPPEKIKDGVQKFSWREKWDRFKGIAEKVANGIPVEVNEIAMIDQMLDLGREEPRLFVLKSHPNLRKPKLALLSTIRHHGIFILEKGAIEDYYPPEVTGKDKPSKALAFCSLHPDANSIKNRCCSIKANGAGAEESEFEAIFEPIFSSSTHGN